MKVQISGLPTWCRGLVVGLLTLSLIRTPLRADDPQGTLIWNNGESLKGTFAASDGEMLNWNSELFLEPLSLRLPALRRVELLQHDIMGQGPFAVFLADGSRLHGDVTAVDHEHLTLQSAELGTVQVKRTELRELLRLTGDKVVYAGPCGTAGWRAVKDPERGGMPADPPRTGKGGVLIAPGWNHRAALDVKLPERMDMEIRMISTEQPAFGLELGSHDSPLALQTWGDEVVLLWGSHFVSLMRLGADDHAVVLRVLWDRVANRCAVFKEDGTPLCEWQSAAALGAGKKESSEKKEAPQPPGAAGKNPILMLAQSLFNAAGRAREKPSGKAEALILQNRGRDLTVERLVIREWGGQEPQPIKGEGTAARLSDGSTLTAMLDGLENGAAIFKTSGGEEKRVPLAQLMAINFGGLSAEAMAQGSKAAGSAPSPNAPAEVWMADGGLVVGKLTSVKDGSVRVQTAYAPEPLACKISAISRLNLDEPLPANTPEEPPLNRMDRLVWATTTIHGTWSAGNDATLRWLPVAGIKAVPINQQRNVEITRAVPAEAATSPTTSLFHLSTGDILPGRLTSMDEENVGIESPLLDLKQIPTGLLRAVQFPSMIDSRGFRDKGWQIYRGSSKGVERKGDKVTLKPGAGFGHPLMMQADDVSFSVVGDQRSFASVRVRMFAGGSGSESSDLRLIVAHYGNRLYAGEEQGDGQFASRTQVNIQSEKAAKIRLVPHAKDVEVFINGASMLKIPSDAQKRKGVGLVFETCNLWGNGEYESVISDFAATANPGRAWLPGVDTTARNQAVMVPRFRKETPPHHVLIAQNGDVLRGDLLAGTSSHFSFRIGLDTYQIPRDRVTSAIWLQKPPAENKGAAKPEEKSTATVPNVPAEGKKPTHWLQLMAGARFGITLEKMENDAVVGENDLCGRCRIPIAMIYKIRNTRPGADLLSATFDSWKLEFAREPEIAESGGSGSPLLGKMAPEISLPLVNGSTFKLGDHRGKVVVLDFWATWCAPCVRSMPNMIEAMAEFPADKVLFVGINRGESAEQVKKFLAQRGWKLEVALDTLEKISLQYGVDGIPHTIIVAPDGKVAWANTGDNSPALAPEAVRKLLADKKKE